jgi:hypothetical protein
MEDDLINEGENCTCFDCAHLITEDVDEEYLYCEYCGEVVDCENICDGFCLWKE